MLYLYGEAFCSIGYLLKWRWHIFAKCFDSFRCLPLLSSGRKKITVFSLGFHKNVKVLHLNWVKKREERMEKRKREENKRTGEERKKRIRSREEEIERENGESILLLIFWMNTTVSLIYIYYLSLLALVHNCLTNWNRLTNLNYSHSPSRDSVSCISSYMWQNLPCF